METISEKTAKKMNGFAALALTFVFVAITVLLFYIMLKQDEPLLLLIAIPMIFFSIFWNVGFMVIQPNDSRVLILFGKYNGTVKDDGFFWVNPFTQKRHVSLRIRNFNSDKIKVNDLHGNPIEIAAVVVWRVTSPARAVFDVENYEQFVAIQSETAIRSLASEYPYDTNDGEKDSLRSSPTEVADNLQKQLQSRLEITGV